MFIVFISLIKWFILIKLTCQDLWCPWDAVPKAIVDKQILMFTLSAGFVRSPCQYIDNDGKTFRPTLKPTSNFDVNADVEALCKSMRCWGRLFRVYSTNHTKLPALNHLFIIFSGTDEDTIINILGRRTSAERMQIVNLYNQKYGRVSLFLPSSATKNHIVTVINVWMISSIATFPWPGRGSKWTLQRLYHPFDRDPYVSPGKISLLCL